MHNILMIVDVQNKPFLQNMCLYSDYFDGKFCREVLSSQSQVLVWSMYVSDTLHLPTGTYRVRNYCMPHNSTYVTALLTISRFRPHTSSVCCLQVKYNIISLNPSCG